MRGFAVTRQAGRKKKEGLYTKYDLVCDRYGKSRPSESISLRESATRKCGYQQKTQAILTQDRWSLSKISNFLNAKYNYRPSLHPLTHLQYRKLIFKATDIILNTSKHYGIRAREVGALVKDQLPDLNYVRKDIYNVRAWIRKRKLGGRTPFGALIKSFQTNGIKYVVEWENQEEIIFKGIVFILAGAMDLIQQYWKVMYVDLIYGTNILNFPLY